MKAIQVLNQPCLPIWPKGGPKMHDHTLSNSPLIHKFLALGNQSTIHDHANAHCFVKVLDGGLREVR